MKNFLILIAFVALSTIAVNAQSKECCKKEKCKTTNVEKSLNSDQTMKSGDKVETIKSTKLVDGKEIIEKEVIVTQMDKKGECNDKSSCCGNMKKNKKVQKELEEKETKK